MEIVRHLFNCGIYVSLVSQKYIEQKHLLDGIYLIIIHCR